MDDLNENAEILLQQSTLDIDFRRGEDKNNNTSNQPGIADDLAFIMQNTAIHDPNPIKVFSIDSSSTSGASDSDSDSTSDVEIVEKPKQPKHTICISSSSEDEEEEENKKVTQPTEQDTAKERNIQLEIKGVGVVCKTLLKDMIHTVVRSERCGKDDVDDDESSSSENEVDEQTEQDRLELPQNPFFLRILLS